ncbi:3-deoxy-8-phosphooctulonate synthase [Neptuniibacter pectenicola]|uniref:2-dehydro-3-deoxyphosphooctonate aldolase n=1 Tax=Neptuniibacter pectenicola TaxID=1806669 RepID=A0ABU9TW08_9GAMM
MNNLFFLAGPCAIESKDFALETAEQLKEIFSKLDLPFYYKSSFDKANRSSTKSYRGVGLDKGLEILAEVKSRFDIPVVTDVHEVDQIVPVAEVVDLVQTPAYLCRQTDFIRAVAKCGKPVNIKKGQFLAPWEMANVMAKAKEAAEEEGLGHLPMFACERGSSFGYGNLVVDMRGLQIMKEKTGCPIIFDATHSVQLPGGQGDSSGGQREYVPHLARAAVATGAVSGVFLETHPDPDKAPCDGPNMIRFQDLPGLLSELKQINAIVNSGKQ